MCESWVFVTAEVTLVNFAFFGAVEDGSPSFEFAYTLGCHSLRHLIGGKRNTFSDAPAQKKALDCVSCLNRKHMMWAWFSLFWVGFSDLYVRLVSQGIWTDFRIL